ncbi:MAG: hypothetical protein AAGA96_11600 [Verrucomicrobiota bacterium]
MGIRRAKVAISKAIFRPGLTNHFNSRGRIGGGRDPSEEQGHRQGDTKCPELHNDEHGCDRDGGNGNQQDGPSLAVSDRVNQSFSEKEPDHRQGNIGAMPKQLLESIGKPVQASQPSQEAEYQDEGDSQEMGSAPDRVRQQS